MMGRKYTTKPKKTKGGYSFKWASNPDRMWAGGTITTKTRIGATFKRFQMQRRVTKWNKKR